MRVGEHASRLWVPLLWLTGSEPLMRMGELYMHPVGGCLSCVSQDQNHWQEGWTCIQTVSASSVLDGIRTTDENGWTCIQAVSSSPVFNRIRIIRSSDESGWTPIQWVSCSPMFEQIRTPDGSGWISTGRQWVLLHLFSRSETLLKMDNIVECIYFDSLS